MEISIGWHYLYIPLIIPEKTIRLSGVWLGSALHSLAPISTHSRLQLGPPLPMRYANCDHSERDRDIEREGERPNGIERAGKLSLRCPHTEHT